jgi:hypothetical protein
LPAVVTVGAKICRVREPWLPSARPEHNLALTRGNLLQIGIERASFLPTDHVQRSDEFSGPIGLGAEQPKLDDLFVGEVLAQLRKKVIE